MAIHSDKKVLVEDAEAAAPYKLRAFWVRFPRAGNLAAYSGRCPDCGRRSRVTVYTGAYLTPQTPYDLSCGWCSHVARFAEAVLPPLPAQPAPTERQIRNRVGRRGR